jgi:HSP20 family protein
MMLMTTPFSPLWRAIDSLSRETGNERWRSTVVPATDVVETAATVELQLDMPGVKPEEIEVRVEGNRLTVVAQRAAPDSGFLQRERLQGAFERSFTIPSSIDGSNPTLHYAQGVLTISLPKRAEAQKKTFRVGAQN